MADSLWVLAVCCLAALCLAAADTPGASVDVTSVAPPQREQSGGLSGDNVIPLLSQFAGQDPLEEESTDEAGGPREKRTFCKKCGGKKRGGFGFRYGGGKKRGGGGYRVVVPVPVPVQVVPVYSRPRPRPRAQYCDPCSRGGYHPQGGWGGGGGGGSYAESFSYSRAYSSGKRK